MENQKLKSQIEAILFLTDKPMKAGAIARILNQDLQVTRQALLELIHDYEERAGGLEVADDDGYIIQVRSEYAFIIDEFAPMDMSVALLRTLSAVAIKQPVPQSEIIKIRGAGAYDHIKELLERELVQKKEEGGRSPMLSTTKKFQEYFRLTQDAKVLRMELVKEKQAEVAQAAALAGENKTDEIAASVDNVLNFAPDHSVSPRLEESVSAFTDADSSKELSQPAENEAGVVDTPVVDAISVVSDEEVSVIHQTFDSVIAEPLS